MDNLIKNKASINGVIVQPLKQIMDDRGGVLHMLRRDSDLFLEFGEVYFSEVNPSKVKGWKRQFKLTQHLACPIGCIRLVLYDDRKDSTSKGQINEFILGRPDNYCLVQIPPNIWYGFQGIAGTPSLLANCINFLHDNTNSEQLPISTSEIPYTWPPS